MHCQYCNKVCKNHNSFINHERLCPNNPDRKPSYFETHNPRSYKRSNGYIKAKENGTTFIVKDETREKQRAHIKTRSDEWNRENGKKISETINRKVSEGAWHTSLARRMHINYNGVDLHGKWELRYAQYLDANHIIWERNTKQFPYMFNGKLRKYTPDFYLPETNQYVEVKGYTTQKDLAKWEQFPASETLIVLTKKELKLLGISTN